MFALLASMCLPGCWDYEKINDRAQVLGIGVDPAADAPGQLVYTIQIPKFGAGPSSQGGQSQQSGMGAATYHNYITRGISFVEALEKAQRQSDKVLYLGNLECVILNQNLSAENVEHVVSELMSMRSVDKLSWLAVSPESTQAILNVLTDAEVPADFINRYYSSPEVAHGYSTRVRLWEFWKQTRTLGTAPYAGIVQSNRNKLVFNGMEVFDKTAPTLTLSNHETLSFNFVKGLVNGISMQIGGVNQRVEVHEVRSRSRKGVSLSGTKPTLHIHVRVKAILLASRADRTEGLDDAQLRQQELQMANEIKSSELGMLKKLQRAGLDAFGFGEDEVIAQPSTESFVRDHWQSAFSKANLDVAVRVQLLTKGELS